MTEDTVFTYAELACLASVAGGDLPRPPLPFLDGGNQGTVEAEAAGLSSLFRAGHVLAGDTGLALSGRAAGIGSLLCGATRWLEVDLHREDTGAVPGRVYLGVGDPAGGGVVLVVVGPGLAQVAAAELRGTTDVAGVLSALADAPDISRIDVATDAARLELRRGDSGAFVSAAAAAEVVGTQGWSAAVDELLTGTVGRYTSASDGMVVG